MYFRLSWFRNRWRFAAYLAPAIALAAFSTLPMALRYDETEGWSVQLALARQSPLVWSDGITVLALALALPLIIMAADYGAHALGDSKHEAVEFLLTRPRSRSHFTWSGWTAGVSQLAVVAALPTIVGAAILRLPTTYVDGAAVAGLFLFLTFSAVFVFGAAYVASVATGVPRQGYNIAIGIAVVYIGTRFAASVTRELPDNPLSWNFLYWGQGKTAFPLMTFLLLAAVIVGLPWAAGWMLRRREI